MKNSLPDNNHDLVSFLQQHRPIPPKADPHLEARLMSQIEQESSTVKKASGLFLAIPGAIAFGLIITWNSQRFLQPTPQLAQDIPNIESFLVNSWEATIKDSSVSTTPEAEVYHILSTVESSPQVVSTTAFE